MNLRNFFLFHFSLVLHLRIVTYQLRRINVMKLIILSIITLLVITTINMVKTIVIFLIGLSKHYVIIYSVSMTDLLSIPTRPPILQRTIEITKGQIQYLSSAEHVGWLQQIDAKTSVKHICEISPLGFSVRCNKLQRKQSSN